MSDYEEEDFASDHYGFEDEHESSPNDREDYGLEDEYEDDQEYTGHDC